MNTSDGTVGMYFELPAELRDQFKEACSRAERSASAQLRLMMRQFIRGAEEPRQQHLTPAA